MTTLYKRDKKGKVRAWTIEHDAVSYWTISGIYPDGKMTKTAPTFVERKNVGKANETSLEQQVLNEVASKIQYQIDQGFTYEIPSDEKRFEVSLANKYQDRLEKGKLDFPYICEAKLDGIRATLQLIEGKVVMKSRKGKEFVACPHIAKNEFVKKFFETYPDAILDGELYNHELKDDFNKIVSLVKKTKPKPEDLEESTKLVQYHCFDSYYPSEPQLLYIDRKIKVLDILENLYKDTLHLWEEGIEQPEHIFPHEKYGHSEGFAAWNYGWDNVRLVGCSHVCYNANELEFPFKCEFTMVSVENHVEKEIELFTSQGYEGIMLKKDVPYFFGRSSDMLKYKKFFDKEYRIIDFEEGNGNLVGIAAAVICETEDGQTFKAGVMGTQDYARDLFSFKDLYKGKMATIVYQALTPMKDGKGGVPRFGKMREIRNYE